MTQPERPRRIRRMVQAFDNQIGEKKGYLQTATSVLIGGKIGQELFHYSLRESIILTGANIVLWTGAEYATRRKHRKNQSQG